MNDFVDNLYEQLREQNAKTFIRIATAQLIIPRDIRGVSNKQMPDKGLQCHDQ